MADFKHSKLSVVKLDTAGGSLTDISQYTNSVTLPEELEEVETTSFGATSRTYIAGFASGSVSLSGHYDKTFDTQMTALFDAFKAGTLATASFEYGPQGVTAGDPKRTGELIMTSYELGSEIEDPVSWSAEFRVSGTLTHGTY